MKTIHSYKVVPAIPKELDKLKDLAYNLCSTWDHQMIDLFRRLDSDLWEKTYHNPVMMLGAIKQERLLELSQDDSFIAYLDSTYENYQKYLKESTWFQKHYANDPIVSGSSIAYFSAEFGLTEALPIYSGGLGVLAGDHLKSASELGIPLVGVGLAYKKGYFQQYLNKDGWQQETYNVNDFNNLAMELCCNESGEQIFVDIDLPGRKVWAQIWKVKVGRIILYLLDTNITTNSKRDQDLTDHLYGGDLETRIQQETLLGIGGYKALKSLGIIPGVCHINEGHSAFLSLEKIRIYMKEENLSFREAVELTRSNNVFTTHTPVPAGIDIFPIMLMDKYFGKYYSELGISRDEFLSLGRKNQFDRFEDFNMAVFAMRLSSYTNGVSKLHGHVSRKMWQSIWQELPTEEIPIQSVTNGIFPQAWISKDMKELFTRYLGSEWTKLLTKQTIWDRVDNIPAEELWRTHERRRERLVAFTRRQLRKQLEHRGATTAELFEADEVLDPEALTIGFARRFATYKRATLLFQDLEKLEQLIGSKDKPIQFIFAGKAHPHDNNGKQFIKEIIQVSKMKQFRNRIVFLENYDMNVARYLVQGVDVWLNNPLRPQEASGTSGMKVCFNGGLNCSVLDGWWDEAYKPSIGWAIGKGENYESRAYQDKVESNAIYSLFEKDIIPTFYDRTTDGLPRKWINMMKENFKEVCPFFNTDRMVQEYMDLFYSTLMKRKAFIKEDGNKKIKDLVQWKNYVYSNWSKLNIRNVATEAQEDIKVGQTIKVTVDIDLAQLKHDDILVQSYYGKLDENRDIGDAEVINLDYIGKLNDNIHQFVGTMPTLSSGMHGFSIRLLPNHHLMVNPFEMNIITWQ